MKTKEFGSWMMVALTMPFIMAVAQWKITVPVIIIVCLVHFFGPIEICFTLGNRN